MYSVAMEKTLESESALCDRGPTATVRLQNWSGDV